MQVTDKCPTWTRAKGWMFAGPNRHTSIMFQASVSGPMDWSATVNHDHL